MKHERLMVNFARDCRSTRSKLPPAKADQTQHAIEIVMEYIDSVGLVVLKLYEISEKLYNKTLDPYSYTMSDYHTEMKHFKKLNEVFEEKGKALNLLLYGNLSENQKAQQEFMDSMKGTSLNKVTSKFSKPKNDSDDVESDVLNTIIEVCYAYDTTPYINSIEKTRLDGLTPSDRKALDPVLSCLSLGIAIRFLKNKYSKKSEYIIKKLLARIYSAVLSATNSTDTSAEDVANFYVELINNYSSVLDYDGAGLIDYGLGVCEKVFEPVEELFEQLKPDPQIALYIISVISGFGANIKRIIETAEEKYNYSQ